METKAKTVRANTFRMLLRLFFFITSPSSDIQLARTRFGSSESPFMSAHSGKGTHHDHGCFESAFHRRELRDLLLAVYISENRGPSGPINL